MKLYRFEIGIALSILFIYCYAYLSVRPYLSIGDTLMDVVSQEAKVERLKIVALVRNKHGQPQFNDYNDIPEVYHSALTEEDWVYINEMRKD